MKSNLKIKSRLIIITFILSIAIVSASYSQEKATDAIPPLNQKPKINRSSQFLSELSKQGYSETKAPSKAPVFRWNFSDNNDTHKYAFEQKVHSESDMGKSFESGTRKNTQDMFVNGKIILKRISRGLLRSDPKPFSFIPCSTMGGISLFMVLGSALDPVSIAMFILASFKTNSAVPSPWLFMYRFPLPSKDLKVSEYDDVPAQMPFNAMGSMLLVKGYSRIALTRYVEIDGHTCAELDVDINISDINIPSELEGEYECSAKGRSLYYFDIDNRRFVSGVTTLLMSYSIDAPIPKMNVPDEKSLNAPKRAKMSMANDNLIKVSLIN